MQKGSVQEKGGVSRETFFERRILKPKEVFYLSYCWTRVRMPVYDQTAPDMRRGTGSTISSATLVSYFKVL